MRKYVVVLENRHDCHANLESYFIEAKNIGAAYAMLNKKVNSDNYYVYAQSVESVWFNHPERRNRNV